MTRCLGCPHTRYCPRYLPGAGCAYAPTTEARVIEAHKLLRRYHSLRIAGAAAAIAGLVMTAGPRLLW